MLWLPSGFPSSPPWQPQVLRQAASPHPSCHRRGTASTPDLFCSLQGLLGDRYEHQTVPRLIAEKEFEALILQLSGGSAQLLAQWYRRDDNALPACYVLQPADGRAWHHLRGHLASALRVAAHKAERCGLLSPEQRHRYHKSGASWQGCIVLPARAGREESCSVQLCMTGRMQGRKRIATRHIPDPQVGGWC